MIVNKPQFDTDKIKPGQAYWLVKKDYRNYFEINTPCIILKVNPLHVHVTYWNEDKLSEYHVTIDDVVDKKFTLEHMKVVKE